MNATTVADDIRGHLVVVMAPSGSGKGTLVKKALEAYPNIYKKISCTSREKRPGEEDGKQYYFLTDAEFQQKIDAGDFLEWAEFAGHKYGTLKSEILPRLQDPQLVLLEMELQGVEQLVTLLPREYMTIVYVDAGDWETLKARIIARSPITEEELEGRRQRFLIEEQAKSLADVIIDNSGDLEGAYQQFSKVIEEALTTCKK